MQLFELDNQLIQINDKCSDLNERFRLIDEEIELLQYKRDGLKGEIYELEKQIKDIKNKLLNMKLQDTSTFTDDKFTNDFILASYFAEKCEEDRQIFQYVSITDNELMATDSYRGIIIRCDCIPDEVKNSKIKWDVRSNFAGNINRELGEFPDLKGIIEKAKSTHKKVPNQVTANDFYSSFEASEPENWIGGTCIKLKIDDVKIAFNKEYLDTALTCMCDEFFDVYVHSNITPLLLENQNKSIVVLPLRVSDWG